MAADVNHAGTYDCISYVWGPETELTQVTRLNKKRFRVRANVHQILSQQASYWRSKLIWIDGICINQRDKADKTTQVRLMTDIYARATRVFLCLGNPPNATLGVLVLYWVRLMRHHMQSGMQLRHMEHFRALKRDVDVLEAAWQAFARLGRPPSLSEALVSLAGWRSGLPRDKLFALFGLTDDAESLKTFIDYEKEDQDILCGIARYFEKRQCLLEVLHFAGIGWGKAARNPKLSGVPSWAPDWTTPRTPASLAIPDSSNESTHYSIAIQQSTQLTLFRESLVLKLQGTFLDTLKHAGPATDFDFGEEQVTARFQGDTR